MSKCNHKWDGVSSGHSGIKGVLHHFYVFIDKCTICKIIRIKRDFTFGYKYTPKITYRYYFKGVTNE